MFLTVHGSVGALIGVATGNPLAAFVASGVSHFVLDAVPHGDEHLAMGIDRVSMIRRFTMLAAVDGMLMTVVLALLLRPWNAMPSLAVLAGIVGGVLPDVVQGLSVVFPANRPLERFRAFHDFCHLEIIRYECSMVVGMIGQLCTLTAAVFLLRTM